MKSMLALLACIFAVATAAPHASGVEHECLPLWTRFQGNCYRFFGAAKTWENAEAHCHEHFMHTGQAHLVSLHSAEESDFVYTLWQSSLIKTPQVTHTYNRVDLHPGVSFLIGLNDKTTEGTWAWSDGTDYDYNAFAADQPDNAGSREDCAQVYDQSGVKAWNDIPCSWDTDLPYVCKVSAHAELGIVEALIQSRAGAGGDTLG